MNSLSDCAPKSSWPMRSLPWAASSCCRLLAILLAGCSAEGSAIQIGLVSAAVPQAGDAPLNGMRLALDAPPKKGEASMPRRILLRHAVAKNAEECEAQGVRLAGLGRAAVLFGGTNGEETERLDRLQVPLFSFSARDALQRSDRCVTLGLDPEDQAAAAVVWLRTVGATSTTLVRRRDGAADAWALPFQNAWTEAAKETKAELHLAEPTDLIASETIVFAGTADDLATFVAAGLDDKTKRIVYLGREPTAAQIAAARTPRRSLNWTVSFALDPEVPSTKEFADQYRTRFGEAPTADAVLAYDSLLWLLQAARSTRSASAERWLEEMKTQTFDGTTGPMRIEKGRMRRPAFVVRASEDGTPLPQYRWLPPPKKNETNK